MKNIYKNSEIYKLEYKNIELPLYLHQVIIGLLLSDGSLEKSSPTSETRLSVSFGLINSPYLFHLYNLLEPYCNSPPNFFSVYNKKTNSNNTIIKFKTVSLPLFSYYHKMFYKYDSNLNKYVKILPSNIKNLISPVALAHLIMGDGNFKKKDKIIRIYTNSFKENEVKKLAKILTNKLNIITRAVHDRNDQYILVISKNQIDIVISLIEKHIHKSMLYKLGISNVAKFGFNYCDVIEKI